MRSEVEGRFHGKDQGTGIHEDMQSRAFCRQIAIACILANTKDTDAVLQHREMHLIEYRLVGVRQFQVAEKRDT